MLVFMLYQLQEELGLTSQQVVDQLLHNKLLELMDVGDMILHIKLWCCVTVLTKISSYSNLLVVLKTGKKKPGYPSQDSGFIF